MSYIKRDIETVINEASAYYAATLVTGPRQVGKTTTLHHLMEQDRRYVTLDDLDEQKLAQSDPELFLSLHPAPLLIDEVQYAPQLFSYIKIAIDRGAAPGSFWMTGSQAFRLMELAQESLAGRVALINMPALSQHEIYGNGTNSPMEIDATKLQSRRQTASKTDIHGIYKRIWSGALPGLISGKYPNREMFYSNYLQTYIQRDIGDVTQRLDSLCFADFIRAAACRAGQMLNVHSIAGDVGVSDDTAKRWLLLLERSGVIFFVRPYFNNLLKRTVKTPKMYFFDTGLVAYLTKYSDAEILMNGALNGAILENYVVAEIIKSYTNSGKECFVYYYRDKDNREIDLILERDSKLHPMEIKRSATPGLGAASAFRALDAASLPRGLGAIFCMKEDLSALDKETLLVPIWLI